MSTTKQSTAIVSISGQRPSGISTNGYTILGAQFISDPITVQTITGTVKGQFYCNQSNNLANMARAIVIKVVSNDGTVERGTLYSAFDDTSRFSSTQSDPLNITNRYFPASVSMTDVTACHGDRLVIEIGAASHTTSSTSTRSYAIRTGDDQSTDAPENQTDKNYTTMNPWIEFSQDINFNVQNIMMFRLTC